MSTCKFCDAEIEWIDRVPHNLDHSRHTCQRKQKTLPEPRDCKFECKTLLLWDDNHAAYKEVNTGEFHSRERCQEAKLKLELKNNHGNETATQPLRPPINTDEQVKPPYVDHTQPAKLKLKILTDPTPEGLALAYNNFGENHKIQFSQYHPVNALYTIAVWYEEIKQ